MTTASTTEPRRDSDTVHGLVRPLGSRLCKHGRMTIHYRAIRDGLRRHCGQVVGVVDGKDVFALIQRGVRRKSCAHLVGEIKTAYDQWSNAPRQVLERSDNNLQAEVRT